jgi:hypothetical protein
MGTYQKMKQAERVVKLMTANYEDHKDDTELSEMSLHRLESAREKYRSLKYEYTIQSSILILVVFVTIAIATSYLLGGV